MHNYQLILAGMVVLTAIIGGGMMMALTTEPNLRQSNSAYTNISREDLMDVLERVDPAQTPVYTMAARENELGNTEFSWEVEDWPNPNGAFGPGDGYAVQTTEVRNVASTIRKMGNYGQAFRRAFGAGWIANRVPTLPGLGSGKILAKGQADAMVLLKQDIECAFTSFDQTATPDQGGATGSLMAGCRKLIDKANQYAGASAFTYGKPTDLQFAPTGAVLTGTMTNVFNLSAVRTILQALRSATKRNKDYWFLCGLDLRAQVTGLIDPTTTTAASGITATQSRIFRQDLSDAELGISIEVIRTDYGRLLVVPTDLIGQTMTDASGSAQGDAARSNRVFLNKTKNGLILSREMVFKRIGVAVEPDQLQNDGGGTLKQMRTYQSLGVSNPEGFGFLELT